MTWQVKWTPPAQRDMARVPVRIAEAIITYVVLRLAENPARLSKPLTGELIGLRSARNGDYRVLLRLDPELSTVWILRVDHRAHVYRPQ